MDKQALKDAIKKTLLRTSVYFVLGFIYVGTVEHFIDNRLYSSLFIIISLLCFFVIHFKIVMGGAGTDAQCYTVIIEGECEYDNNYDPEEYI